MSITIQRIGYSDSCIRSGVPKPADLIRSSLVGRFDAAGIAPIPLLRSASAPIKIYNFNDVSAKWGEYNIADIREKIESIRNSQLAITEAPVKMEIGVTNCAAVTLYDPGRKIGAAMHFHDMKDEVYRGYISLALHKMGAVMHDRLSCMEARIMGVEPYPALVDRQTKWVRDIRRFLEACSINVLPDDVGRRMVVVFDLKNGGIER